MILLEVNQEMRPGSFGLRVGGQWVTVPAELMTIFAQNCVAVAGQVLDFLTRNKAHIMRKLAWEDAAYDRALDEARLQLAAFPPVPVMRDGGANFQPPAGHPAYPPGVHGERPDRQPPITAELREEIRRVCAAEKK